METYIKKAVKSGNSSAVILPRAWLNKEVRIELIKKNENEILHDALEIINKHTPLKSIIGVYLVGSYARGEEDENSDIDILIITKDIDKPMISDGIYNILIISLELLNQKLERDLFPIGQMIKEAKPLLNAYYLADIKIKVTDKNIKWYLETTEEKLKIIKKYIQKSTGKEKSLSDVIAYTLVLRIRTLDIIKKLIENKNYSKEEFINKINKISSANAYERYLAVKDNQKDEKKLNVKEAEKLQNYLEKELIEVKRLVGKLKS